MRVTTAFNRLLGLPGVEAKGVSFDDGEVVVDVELRRLRLVCPRCEFSTSARYDTRRVPRVGGTPTWAGGGSPCGWVCDGFAARPTGCGSRVGIEGSGNYGRAVAAHLVIAATTEVVEVPPALTFRERGGAPGPCGTGSTAAGTGN